MFHEKKSCLDLEQFPPTSNAIKLHIYRAYLQAHLSHHAVIKSAINIDPEPYGFTCDEDLVPIMSNANLLPADFSFPCKCTKCKFDKRCPYQLKELACCQYCKNNCLNVAKFRSNIE